MSVFKLPRDEKYWRQKIAAFLHDPPDKALSIADHVGRSKALTGDLYVSADEGLVKKADQVASGLDRTSVPDKDAGGYIDFAKYSVVTHPTGRNSAITLSVPAGSADSDRIVQVLQADEEFLPKDQPLRSFALYHYLRHILPWRLAKEGALGLTWQWERLPADTRIPDHTIWQHCALTSALYSCYALSAERRASIMVFSITPVQDFISRSRKLRDFWISSLLLSWLSAEGMKAIVLNYGSDHIIYPWPVGQPLIERMLDGACRFPEKWQGRYNLEPRAATLPNKFVCLVPSGEEDHAAYTVKSSIFQAWQGLAYSVRDLVKDKSFKGIPQKCTRAFDEIFMRQVEHFWEFHWSALSLLDEKAVKDHADFIPEALSKRVLAFLQEVRKSGFPYLSYDEKFFYPISHDLCQRGHGAEKLSPESARPDEPGIKCHLHTDFEALRFSCLECFQEGRVCDLEPGRAPDPNPRPSQDPCWVRIRRAFSESEFKETERLSSIALVKRLAYRAVKDPDHPLYPYFREATRFPSTTEVAAWDWLRRAEKDIRAEELSFREVAEVLHRRESPKSEWNEIEEIDRTKEQKVEKVIGKREKLNDPPHITDRYYALLVMDGDRMGRLLAGGFSAKWRDVLHPELVRRLEKGEVSENYANLWKKYLDEKRVLSPSVHGAISQALADFSLWTVPAIVRKHSGWLIYAGGDDVCAVFPLSTAVDAAVEIAEAYNWAFVKIDCEGSTPQEIRDPSELRQDERLVIHLGPGDEISISAGLLIVHHKWPLRAAVRRAHDLLELAKNSVKNGSDRAAMAVSLHRRAGGERIFVAGFRDAFLDVNIWRAFKGLVRDIAAGKVSASFLYGLSEVEEGLQVFREDPENFIRLVRSQIGKSDVIKSKSIDVDDLARTISSLILGARKTAAEGQAVSTEVVEICDFIALSVRRRGTFG